MGVITDPVVCRPTDSCKCDKKLGCVCNNNWFTNLTPAEKGIGGGAIAGIVVGAAAAAALVALGSKKGYDYYQSKQAAVTGISSNPLYEASKTNMENPLYESNSQIELADQ